MKKRLAVLTAVLSVLLPVLLSSPGNATAVQASVVATAGGRPSTSPSAGAAQAARAAVKPADAVPGDTVITFSEFPDGTAITNQYQPQGIVFGGDSPFITDDPANPTSPVLSGTPQFSGEITGTFVAPDGRPVTVGHFSLDVGYIDDPGSVAVTAFDASGHVLDTETADQTGIVPVTVQASGIASFSVAEVSAEDAGFAIDNVAFPQPWSFTITGHKPLPQPPSPPDPSSEFAEGSPQLARTCSHLRATADHAAGEAVAVGMKVASPAGARFLRHFLAGNGTAVDLADGSGLAADAKRSGIFKKLDKKVQQQAKKLLDAGQRTADVTSVMKNPDFAALDILHPKAALALSEAFGGTQGLDISGSGFRENDTYTGTITYVIRDIYGFYAKSKFLGVGPEMHYLQGVCGAPWYKHGAHWFPDSVTVTIPFDQPADASGLTQHYRVATWARPRPGRAQATAAARAAEPPLAGSVCDVCSCRSVASGWKLADRARRRAITASSVRGLHVLRRG